MSKDGPTEDTHFADEEESRQVQLMYLHIQDYMKKTGVSVKIAGGALAKIYVEMFMGAGSTKQNTMDYMEAVWDNIFKAVEKVRASRAN